MIFALFMNILSAILYFFQKQDPNTARILVGLIAQGFIVLSLVFFLISYRGRRYTRVQPRIFMRYYSLGQGFLVLSLIVGQIGRAHV